MSQEEIPLNIEPKTEESNKITFSKVLEIIKKSGMISRCKGFFASKDVPMLFIGTLLDLLRKIIISDYKNVLSILTQIDFWTLLADYLRYDEIIKCDSNDKRIQILKIPSKNSLLENHATFHVCMVSILEFIIECIFRESQLAGHLLKSTKLMPYTISLFINSISILKSIPESQRIRLTPILDTYTNRCFTLWTQFCDNEPQISAKIFFDEVVKSKQNSEILLDAFNLCNTIDAYAAVCRFVGKIAENWNETQFAVFENDGISKKIITQMLNCYLLTKGSEEIKGDDIFNQQKYDIIKSMTFLVHKSLGAKTEIFSGPSSKQLYSDLTHLASVLYCAVIDKKPENSPASQNTSTLMKSRTSRLSESIVKSKRSVMLNKAIVQKEELINIGSAHETLALLLQFFKSLFHNANTLIYANKKLLSDIVNALLNVYDQSAIMDDIILIHLLEVLATLASQGQSAKELFLQKDAKRCFIEILLKVASSFEIGMDPKKIRRTFSIIQSLSLSKEIVNYIWKNKFIENFLKKLWPVLKMPHKDVIEAYPIIIGFTKFLSVYAFNEDGRKFLQLHKTLFEFYVDLLNKEPKVSIELVEAILMLLRNSAFAKGVKSHFLSIQNYGDTLMNFITGINYKAKIKLIAASALWTYLYNHQGIKANFNKENVRSEIELNKLEYERELDKLKYQEYHGDTKKAEQEDPNDEKTDLQNLVQSLENILKILDK